MASKELSIALCLFPGVTPLDFQGPLELLSIFSSTNRNRPELSGFYSTLEIPHTTFNVVALYHEHAPLWTTSGPSLLADKTYDEVKEQFDIIFIPGGPGSDPSKVDPSFMKFLKEQGPKAKYILTVCTGSWTLAGAGLLNGLRATTNKMLFRLIEDSTKEHNVTWVKKARWVVTDDKRIWTSSGVTAGQDMAAAFLEYVAGPEVAKRMLAWIESTPQKDADVDEFAEYYGLV